ncbi:Pca regulon regulatory protein (plasmid) [Variovorax sp. SRS16]|uniref:IclR family transcriptional regulator n=1 Tax=Variovorax sp. SRS16 TaxID=282217 RepID=UPI00131823CD|nr:IclR family transcriptional regulator [Variovorax sp. SRS16]VTU46311.1 Pca regulon regulatory protein [Variovorax sp. SRS16]
MTRNPPDLPEEPFDEAGGAHVGDRQFAITLARGLDVLRAFSAEAPVLGNKEISQRTGLPKATVSRLTYTLTSLGFLHFLPEAGKYGKYVLGRAVLSMAHPLLANIKLRQAARTPMRELADAVGGAVSLGVRDGLNMVYVHTAKRVESAGWISDIGKTFALGRSCMGDAFLAALPQGTRESLLSDIRTSMPDDWEATASRIERSREQVARLGFCVHEGLVRPRVHVVAASIYLPDQGEPYVFNCAITAEASSHARLFDDIGPRLAELVAQMKERLANAEAEPPQPLPDAWARRH